MSSVLCCICGKGEKKHEGEEKYCWPKISKLWTYTVGRSVKEKNVRKIKVVSSSTEPKTLLHVAVCTLPNCAAYCDRKESILDAEGLPMCSVCRGLEKSYQRYDDVYKCAFRDVRKVC